MMTSQHMIALYKYAPTLHFTGKDRGLARRDFLISPFFHQIYPEFCRKLA